MFMGEDNGESPKVVESDIDRRACLRLARIWDEARGGQYLPQLTNFKQALVNDSLLDAFLLKAEEPVSLSVFVLCGGELAGRFENRLEGTTLAAMLPHQIRNQHFDACSRALRREQPVQLEGRYALSATIEMRYRSALLPVLATEPRGFGYLLGTLNTARYPILN